MIVREPLAKTTHLSQTLYDNHLHATRGINKEYGAATEK